jgi:hypothetical protein
MQGIDHPVRGTERFFEVIMVMIAALLAISVLLAQTLILKPYARMICAAMPVPNRFALRWRAQTLHDAITQAADAPSDLRLGDRALSVWFCMKKRMDIEDHYILSHRPDYLKQMSIVRFEEFYMIAPALQRWVHNVQPLSTHRRWLEKFADSFTDWLMLGGESLETSADQT